MPLGQRYPQQQPADEHPDPYLPPGHQQPLAFEQFNGMNTATTRPGVGDEQAFWIDGFFPYAPKNLRTLPGIGTSIYNSSNGVAFFDFGNIGATPISIVFEVDGSIHQVNTSTLATVQIAPAGTIASPSRANCGISQWGAVVILIVAKQTDGYFIWDGTLFYKAGTLAPLVTITNGGTGYSANPTITATGGTGIGATFTATVAGGVITGITITNPGAFYSAGDTVTLNITDATGTGAAATVTLMPFAIQGTAIETYSGRAWIVNGPVLTFSAPGSYQDFSSANGGGNVESADSFLRVGYTNLKQTNGFLYLIGDSSCNYISTVQTSGTPPVTTFTNQNADPEVGTPWAPTVTTVGRNIIFANAFGVHVLFGAAATKVSNPLDGVYATVPNFAGLLPSAAKTTVFGRKIWMLLLPIVDPITQQQENKLLMWDSETKRWWASRQDVTLVFIQHQEINSVITAYGTDGVSIYPLFSTPSNGFTKTARSKFWDTPQGLLALKAPSRLWGAAQYNVPDSSAVTVTIDSEASEASQTVDFSNPVMTWTTAGGVTMSWTTAGGSPMIWGVGGLDVLAPTAISQVGAYIGLTVSTAQKDWALIGLLIGEVNVQYRG